MKSQSAMIRHEGEKTVYTTCRCNCGSTSQCVFKAHVRDGVVVAVEPDDRVNPGVGREDEILSEQDLIKTSLQRRSCAKGLVFHKYLYHPDRIIYPLQRAPGSKRGEGKYVRISWDKALTIIADNMKRITDEFGPLSIMTPYPPNALLERLFSFWGRGTDTWGSGSQDASRMMAHIMTGALEMEYNRFSSSSAADMLANSKVIVIWGYDPTMGMYGPGNQFAYYVRLCRERNRPVIIIDPRYTVAAEVLADQWIPIKPGTDAAMMMAMANVLFREDLWDKEFVEKFVEPIGFEKWRKYLMGSEDGVEKTPEWAESQCAVPSETIRALTRLIAGTKPAWVWSGWGVNRKSHGEQTVRAFVTLQAMLGFWGSPGAGPQFNPGPSRQLAWRALWGPMGEYEVPKVCRSTYWAQAVLLLEKVKAGELKEEDYIRMTGWQANRSLVKSFNPKMLFWGGMWAHGGDHLVTACDSPKDQIRAMMRMDFTVNMHSIMTPTVQYADIVLPAQDWMWEELNVTQSDYGGFESINCCPGVAKPPGEVRPYMWVYCKLAERLGIDPKKFFRYYTTDEQWEADWETYQKDCYQQVMDWYKKRDIEVPPWEDFINGNFINRDALDRTPALGWEEQIKENKPFKTGSGRIECYSTHIANEANRGKGPHRDPLGRLYTHLAGDWGSLTPSVVYEKTVKGMDDPLVKTYPLMMLSPHGRYRVHYLFWEHPWLREHVYRHSVWISATDAEARGIRDGDKVLIYNDRGKAVMPAYVTSRIMPGVTVIHHGGKYIPGESGIDFGASPSTLLGGDFTSCVTPAKATTLVQIRKYEGA